MNVRALDRTCLPRRLLARAVAVVPLVVARDVDVHDLAVLELARVRDAVADDLVQARAQGFGVTAITEGRWVRALSLIHI